MALATAGCRHQFPKVRPWVWPGANRFNTFHFAQSGTRPGPGLRYAEAWDAEWFDVPATVPIPANAYAGHRPLVADLNRDGRAEIVVAQLGASPGLILNWAGAPLSGRARDGTNWDSIQSGAARIVADDSVWVLLPESSASAPEAGQLAMRVNGRVVTLHVVLEPKSTLPIRVLLCRDGETGRELWRCQFGARADLMAVADLDQDGKEDLLVTTYGDENGIVANGTQDHDSCYCVALRDDGTRLWQHGFGAHPFLGCMAGVADLNKDGKPEVFANVYSWQNDFGGLAVLEGATGRLIAASVGPDSTPVSHAWAGCADVDADGRQELATVTCGKSAEAVLYRLEGNRLAPAARALLTQAPDTGVICEGRLHGICDLDGDGRSEFVVSYWQKRMLCPDPMFYPSRCDSCGLAVLGDSLQRRQTIPLAVRCQDVTLGDVMPGGNIELLVITDRLRLYSTETY